MKKPKGSSKGPNKGPPKNISKGPKKSPNYQKPKPKATPTEEMGDDYSYKDMNFDAPPQISEKWYSSIPEDPKEFPECPINLVNQLREEARLMLESEANGYNIKASKNSEQSWIRSVMAKGTGKDKMAAYILMVQEKPLYNINALRSLIGFVKPGKKECVACIDLLAELFVTDLLPPDTKLRRFSQHPLTMLDELSSGNPAGRRRRLVAWYFEDQLKEAYREFVDSLRTIAGEAVEANKERAIKALATLLETHPEQEALLLSNLVNKMGDPSKKVASKAMHCLTLVVTKHPNMKGIIMDEVEKLLFRPNIGQKARYYSICFLSQIMFKKGDAQLAANIIKIYFGFFKACVKLGEVDSRMLSVLLTGVNRAYPFAREAMDSIAEQLETLYKVIHIAPFHVSLQGLSLLFQVSDYKNNVSDRFYSVLYRKLLDPALGQTSHAPMFLNLTFQALKKDESIPRVKAFIKRLLQVCCHLPIPMMCATLYMVSQLIHQRSALSANSLGFSVKEEGTDGTQETPKGLPAAFLDDDSEDEHYEDVPLEDEESKKLEANRMKKSSSDTGGEGKQSATWVHLKEDKKKIKVDGFNPMQRNPLYANGHLCSYTELNVLSSHFHPTVALFASQILNNQLITYTGDPLKDFTLIRFLERFSFKNPKKQSETTSNAPFAKRQNYSVSGLKGVPVTSDRYLTQEEEKVPVDERFLFKFLQRRRLAAEEKHKDDEDSDMESVASDEFEDMLEDLMKKKGFKKDIDDDDGDFDTEVDFADEYSKNMSSKKSKRKNEDDEDDESDEAGDSNDDLDEDEGMDDDELGDDDDIDGDEELEGEDDIVGGEDPEGDEDLDDFDFDNLDDDAEAMDFDDSDAEIDEPGPSKSHKKKKDMDSEVFASAEEFSELLEAAGAAREGSSSAVSNKDKSSLKQLNWEAQRDRWVKGYKNFTGGKASGGRPNGKGKGKGKPLGVKKPSFKPKKQKKRY